MGWCDDINSKKYYNKPIKTNFGFKHEKLFRKDYKYDYFLPIKYNWNKIKIGKGSAIFIHLTKNYAKTNGCIGLSEKDFLILIKLIKRNTDIKILQDLGPKILDPTLIYVELFSRAFKQSEDMPMLRSFN